MRLYDEKNNVVFISWENENGGLEWEKYEYDLFNNVIKSTASNGREYKIEYDYTYGTQKFQDNMGYWYYSELGEDGKECYFENSLGEIQGTKRWGDALI